MASPAAEKQPAGLRQSSIIHARSVRPVRKFDLFEECEQRVFYICVCTNAFPIATPRQDRRHEPKFGRVR